MIKTLEKSARTEDEAIAAALAELGLDRDDVSVEIVERAKSGFLGIGASPAVIRVSYEAEDEPAAPAAAGAAPRRCPDSPGTSPSGSFRPLLPPREAETAPVLRPGKVRQTVRTEAPTPNEPVGLLRRQLPPAEAAAGWALLPIPFHSHPLAAFLKKFL